MNQALDTIRSYTPEAHVLKAVWIYKDASGKDIGAVARYDLTVVNGERQKQFRPFIVVGVDEELICGGFAEPRPLYGLERLAARPEAAVLVVEGEKTADAAGVLFPDYVVVTSPGGSKAAGKADWAPLAGRQVDIWPDNDAAGLAYAKAVAKLVPQARVVSLPKSLPDKWDLADAAPAGVVHEDLTKLLTEAKATKAETDLHAMFHLSAAASDSETIAEGPADEDRAESDDQIILRLASMTRLQYERVRQTWAKQLGVRASVLDSLVGAARQAVADDERMSSFLVDPEPWPERVDGDDLLDQLAERAGTHLILPPGAATLLALWTVFSHAHDAFWISPILAATSPTPECGKSTLLDLLSGVCPKAMNVSSITAASLFRGVDKYAPTFLLDEGDTYLKGNDDLRAIINSGHKRSSARVLRCDGDSHESKWFSTWCPKAIALIGSLPPTLASRSIQVELQRKLATEVVKPLRLDRLNHLAPLQQQAARWAAENRMRLSDADPAMPSAIYGRMADNWRPLFAIAEVAGGEWPERAQDAAVELSAAYSEKVAAVMLLEDTRDILKKRGLGPGEGQSIWSIDLVHDLVNLEDRAWGTWGRSGKPITQERVAAMLRGFKVVPKQIKREGINQRGYYAAPLYAAFDRYLLPSTEGAIE
jgi:hypothetical protein